MKLQIHLLTISSVKNIDDIVSFMSGRKPEYETDNCTILNESQAAEIAFSLNVLCHICCSNLVIFVLLIFH